MSSPIGIFPQSPIFPSHLGRTFYQVSGNSPLMTKMKEIFSKILEPLYGSQAKALKQIEESKDRKAFLLCADESTNPLGVIVFKDVLSDEFSSKGIANSVEIKSLFVVNSDQNSGKGLGTTLLTKIIEETAKRLDPKFYNVTVSEDKKESLIFFLSKGFTIMHVWDGKYIKGKKEYLLAATPEVLSKIKKTVNISPPQMTLDPASSSSSSPNNPHSFSLLNEIEAHWDDIHTLKLLSDGTFISGSKDNSIIKWNGQGEIVKVVKEIEPVQIDHHHWVTALEVINDSYWISGERSGRVSLWTTKGDHVKDIRLHMPRKGHVSKAENRQRVTCLSRGLSTSKPSFYTGFPTMFNEFNLIEGRVKSTKEVHKNDWVYCIHPLDENKVMTVVAGSLQVWARDQEEWQLSTTLIKETPSLDNRKERAHISVLTPLLSNPNHFATGDFKAQLKIVDVATEKIVRTYQEHKDKIWKIENISRRCFASAGEDGLINIWDANLPRPVAFIQAQNPNEGFSALMSLNDHLLVAGTSSKSRLEFPERRSLKFFDIRQF
ncbi:MAG: hypothetical protein ACOVOR_03565 [Rhabdochlamydiaceae bacterium]